MAGKAGKMISAWQASAAAAALSAALWLALPAWSQQADTQEIAPAIEIYHEPPSGEELPAPAESLTLRVQIINTRDITMKMTAVISMDGRLTQVPLKNEYLNAYDHPEFSLSVSAPQGEMTYQFVLYLPDGTLLSSERYRIRRPCRLDTTLADPKEITKLRGDDRLGAVVTLARNLKLHADAYTQAIALLQELKELIKE